MSAGQQMTRPKQAGGVVERYVFDTLGAPFKVTLENAVSISTDPDTGRENVKIPDMVGLVLAVVRRRAMDSRKLSGEEIKFLRQALGLQANKLAHFLDVTPEHYSRCEAGDRVLSSTAEKHLRLFAFGATLFRSPEELLDAALDRSEAPKPLSKKAQRMERDFLNVFLRMTIAPVRNADEQIEYVFIRCPVVEAVAGDDSDGDWEPQPEGY